MTHSGRGQGLENWLLMAIGELAWRYWSREVSGERVNTEISRGNGTSSRHCHGSISD